ncbi:MAG: MFS transporter, partial [archaeon]|nr:MFS transporter [archaeon]
MTYESKISNENKISYTKKYVYYSAIVFGLINLVDIFNSNAGTLVKSFVVIEFFTSQGVAESVGVSTLGLLSVFGIPLMLLSAGIRYIADKYGRKPALLLNTIGLTIGAGLILIGNTLPMYIIGSLFGTLFLAADIQLMMIQEEAPIEKRSQFLAFARMVGLVGAMLVPFARGLFLTGENPNWRMIYIIPLIGGVIVTIIILLTLKESSVYLTMKAEKRSNPEQLETQKKEG